MLVFSQGVFEQEWHFGYHLKVETNKKILLSLCDTKRMDVEFRDGG